MLRHLAAQNGLQSSNRLTSAQWRELIRDSFDSVFLPFTLHHDRWVIFEVVLRSGRGQYIKIWDLEKTWQRIRDPSQLLEVKTIAGIFFGNADVNVVQWELGDPTIQEGGHGSGALAFMLMTHLAEGVAPSSWTQNDEAVARNFMWACIRHGKVLALPQQRMKASIPI